LKRTGKVFSPIVQVLSSLLNSIVVQSCLFTLELPKHIGKAVSKLEIALNVPELKMSITELLPALKTLSRAEKLRVMQFLVQELAMEEEASLLQTGATYHIWSPLNSHKAAQTLATMLEDEQRCNGFS
jgi:hypothetical protein